MMFDAAAAVVVREAASDTGGHDAVATFTDGATAEHAVAADHDQLPRLAAARAWDGDLTVAGDESGHSSRVDDVTKTTGHDRREMIADAPDAVSTPPRDVIFIDTSVTDYRQLAAEWAGRGEIVLIDGTRDGVSQMQAALAERHEIGAIHIVSHSGEGVLRLGTTRIDEASIVGDLASALGAIGEALRPGGDILIYGCNFGEGAQGARALEAFAGATHADVAASTDTTGYAGRGGDWTLEAHRGAIEARTLDSADWVHTLDPNTPVPISVTADSLTVTDAGGTVVVTGATGYGTDARSPDVGVGAVALWQGAATFGGQSVDLRATVIAISAGDAVRFNRPTGTGANGDDPTFLLRDLTAANDATVQIRWELVLTATGVPLPADVRFTIADIDGIGGNPNTRESVTAATTGLAYYTRERVSDINFTSSLAAITASGTQNENTVANTPITSASAATFDWSAVSSFTLTYKLTTNAVTAQAQFFHDGDADFVYTDPVYVSIPRLDLDSDDGTAAGNDARFTFVEDGAAVPVVDADVVVSNPMDINSVTGATVRLTNYRPGDTFAVGTLPPNVTASIGAVTGGTVTITLSGTGSETEYAAALRAITFRNTSDAPDTTQRVIEVTFSNDTLTSATAISRIDVVPVNDAPSAVGTLPARSTSDTATVAYATAGAFADADGDALSYSATGLPAGLTINAATGVISGTLDRSASQTGGGAYTVVVTARDSSNTTASQSFVITVVNPAPTAVNDTAATTEDTPVTIAVLGNDSDPDGDPLTVTTASALHGTVVRNANGTLTYTPNANYNGSDTISYTISDGQGGTSNATVAVTISPVNDAPNAVGTLPARNTSDAATVSYPTAAAFADTDGDTLSYTASGLPAGLAINAATGVVSGTVDRSASQVGGGSYAVTVTARDPSGATATQSFVITVVNPTPTATNDSATTPEDTPVTIAVLGNDSDPDGDPLTVTAASALHGTVVRNANGTLTYTPDLNYNGGDTISYTISDGQGGTASATVAVTITPVNDAPVRVGTLPARSGVDAGTVSFGIAGGFADPEGDALTYSATGLPAGLSIDAATGVVSGTINRSASQSGGGSYSVVVTARDPAGASTTQGFTYTVTNPVPVAASDSATTAEDTPVTIAVLANDSDPDGDLLSVVAASALHGSVVRNADGTLTYTPDADYNGSDTISYTISDGQGGTASATVAITVTPVNDAPRAVVPPPSYSAPDGSSVSLSITNAFSDPDGEVLTYAATGLPAGLSLDPATGVISGTLDRSASQIGGGAYTIQLTALDPAGATATQTVTFTVTNPPPIAANDSATTAEDTPVVVAVLGNDSDPDGDPLTVTAASALHGSVAINPDGTLTYTPFSDFNGSDTISYTISDGQGGTANAAVAVTVTPVNDAPVPVGTLPARATLDGASVSYPTAGGFADADGELLAYSATGLPAGLAIDAATGVASGTLDRFASQVNGGRYTVTVTARDPSGATATQSFLIDVANPAPVAADDAVSTHVDMPVTIAVLANDGDPDGDPLTVVSVGGAAHGSVAINPGGTLRYTPAPGYSGTDTFTYTISDGQGGNATATVTVIIGNATPVAGTQPPVAVRDGETVALSLAPRFSDPDGDMLTFSAAGLPPGLAIDPATGVVTGTIDRAASQANGGVYDSVITVDDGYGGTTSATLRWTVTDPAPIARDDTAATTEDQPIVIAVLANDSDPDGDPLTVAAASAAHGSALVNPDGSITYMPAPDFTGTDTITYTIDDGHGGRSTATVTVTVTPVNDAPVATPLAPARSSDAQPITLDIGGFFRDPDGDALRFAATGLPPGLAIDPVTGRIAGTVERGASQVPGGVYRVTVTATDPSGASASSSFDWTIVNPAPVARDDAATTPEDTGVVIPVLANDTDSDGDGLRVVSAEAGHGRIIIGPDGQLTYTPDADFNGNDVIVYVIEDGDGARATASVLVTVTPVDDAPVAVQPRPADQTTTDSAPLAIDTAAWFRDVDGDALSYDATGLPPGLAIDPATGAIRGTIDRSASQVAGGFYRVVVVARDPNGAGAAASFDIRVANPAAVARDDAASTFQDGPGITIPVLANDSDPDGDPLQVVAASADHGSVTINPDGTVRYVPGASFAGVDTIRYTITDREGGTAAATVAVTVVPVERPPVAGGVGPVDAIGGRPAVIAVLPGASDPDGDPLTVTAATTAMGTIRVNPDGTLTFTPPLGFVGTATLTYTVSDGRGGTATGTVTVRVADGRGADIEQLLRIGRVTFRDPTPSLATVTVTDGIVRNPLSLLETVEDVRSLRSTTMGEQPVGDAVEAIQTLRGTRIDAGAPIASEIDRLDALRDQRDAGDRLFDQRWGDFMVKGLTGFSAAADRNACVMIESVVHGGAIYLEVRDTAEEGARAPIRKVDIRMANGGRVPDWIKVDPRGMAIIERAADTDELHLVVRVTRTDGSTSSTPIVVQSQTGEVELDRRHAAVGHRAAAPLDLTLRTPSAAIQSEALRLASYFQ